MTVLQLQILYFFSLASILLNLGLLLSGRERVLRWSGWIPVLGGLLAWVAGIVYSGHPPVYNKFETLQQVVFILLLVEQSNRLLTGRSMRASWYLALLLQGLVLLFGLEPDADGFYMYDRLYVILFFQLRITSMGLFALALSSFMECREHRGRNFMLLGAAVFLAGEFSGSWWAQLWWGDPWHWSKGFFYATVMFLLALLGSHIPGRYLKNSRLKPLFSILPLSCILIIYLFSH